MAHVGKPGSEALRTCVRTEKLVRMKGQTGRLRDTSVCVCVRVLAGVKVVVGFNVARRFGNTTNVKMQTFSSDIYWECRTLLLL